MLDDPLRYHGDQAAHGADLDFAVNVHDTTPQWLQDSPATSLGELAACPSEQLDADVRAAIAADHNRSANETLLLHGVAEGFSLLPHLGLPTIIVQPQFTEPEATLRAAGVGVDSLVLPSPCTLRPTLVDVHENISSPHSQQLDGRMVIIGNPTNPTSVAHSADNLRGLVSHCGILVVDEASMDVADGGIIQRCSLADCGPGEANGILENVIVFRSMTKTWVIAGPRCGYAPGTPELLAKLTRPRPHWSLGTLQLTTMAAIARREGELLPQIRVEIGQQREIMTQLLMATGWQVLDPEAPFVLARPDAALSMHDDPGAAEVDVVKHECLRQRFAAREVAVRRCDTFAGLDGSWWRLAVWDEASMRWLIAEVADLLSQNRWGGAEFTTLEEKLKRNTC